MINVIYHEFYYEVKNTTQTWNWLALFVQTSRDISSISNSKIFVSVKNYWRISKIIELATAITWNTSAKKIPDDKLGYENKIGRNATFVLKLVSGRFPIQNVTFFSSWVFFHDHSRITGLQGKGQAISLTPLYHFHPLHRHLDINQAITAESSPLHIVCSQTRTGNLWFPSTSR